MKHINWYSETFYFLIVTKFTWNWAFALYIKCYFLDKYARERKQYSC
jgi:hypothetical protein